MKLTIKRVSSLDIGPLREMNVAFRNEMGTPYPIIDDEEIDKHMLNILAQQNAPEYVYLIAYDGKKPAGYFLGYVGDHPWSRPSRVGVSQELYVVPGKRGGKVGFNLMATAAKLALELGAEGFECIGTYNGTDKMWEKFGFKPHLTYGHIEPEDFMKLVARGV